MGVNSVTLVGRAGRDPEVRYFESGSMVANLTIAVNRRSRDDEPDWFNLEIWGKQAQVAADYVKKGSLLGIIGSYKLDRWTDRNSGEERSKPVVRWIAWNCWDPSATTSASGNRWRELRWRRPQRRGSALLISRNLISRKALALPSGNADVLSEDSTHQSAVLRRRQMRRPSQIPPASTAITSTTLIPLLIGSIRVSTLL